MVSMRIQLFISMRIQRAKPMRVHAHPDPGQATQSQKVEFLLEKNISRCAAYIGIGGMKIEDEPRH